MVAVKVMKATMLAVVTMMSSVEVMPMVVVIEFMPVVPMAKLLVAVAIVTQTSPRPT